MYTVSDFYNTYKNDVSLIAGAGGISKTVLGVSFLDYELVPELKDKYFHINFGRENVITLTSLLYAKDNPYAIIDVIKYLASKNTSGLIIRNVFKLSIPEAAIRYADSKNFPIFLLESSSLFFEDIILKINQHQELQKSFVNQQALINKVLHISLSDNEIKETAYQLNPSLDERFFCAYYKFEDTFVLDEQTIFYERFAASIFDESENSMVIGKKGILFICSGEKVINMNVKKYVIEFSEQIIRTDSKFQIGISDLHNTLKDFKSVINESIYASLYCSIANNDISLYNQLNTYKIIFSYAYDNVMATFSNNLLEPIIEFDTCNNYDFFQTLRTYILFDSNVTDTANATGQHEQTIRYRLNKIYSLLNINPKSINEKEQLAIAMKIKIARELLEDSSYY